MDAQCSAEYSEVTYSQLAMCLLIDCHSVGNCNVNFHVYDTQRQCCSQPWSEKLPSYVFNVCIIKI